MCILCNAKIFGPKGGPINEISLYENVLDNLETILNKKC